MDQHIKEIIVVGQHLAQKGLIQAHSGNISCRLPDGSILITASGVNKGALSPSDVLRLDENGQVLAAEGQAKPSSEKALHVALYQAYGDIGAIVHAHPPYATALACSGRKLNWQLLEEGRLFLHDVPLLAYFPVGSSVLAQEAAKAAAGANALLLANHGAVSWGETLEEALCRMEIIEHIAQVMLYTQLYIL